MTTSKNPASDLLSQAAQQRLHARIADAHGDIASVADEVRAQLAVFDQTPAVDEHTRRMRLSDRAFFVTQLTYLEQLAQAANQPSDTQKPGALARIRSLFRRAQPIAK
jgi:hypothetical protein